MPKPVQRAMLIFCIVGGLSLLTDGVLLALSMTRHHMAQTTQDGQPAIVFQPNLLSTPKHPSPPAKLLRPNGVSQPAQVPVLLLSSSHLMFRATQGQGNPAPQTVTFSARKQAFSWQLVPTETLPAWLQFSTLQGSTPAGVATTLEVNVHAENLAPGLYTAEAQIKAFLNPNTLLVGSPKMLVVTLNVSSSCTLSVTPLTLSFTSGPEAASKPQALGLTENSSCALPVYWQVTADAPWVRFFRTSGTDSNSGGSIMVSVNSSRLPVGPYQASIFVRGTDSSGAPLLITPTEISVSLSVSE